MNISYQDRSYKRLYTFAGIITLACAIITLILRFIIANSLHSDLGGVEQNVIYSIQKLLYDGAIYTDPDQPLFSITQYTPLYHYICAAFASLTGSDPQQDIHQLYVIGRGLNIFFNLLLALVIYSFAGRHLRLPVQISTILALAYFVSVFRQGFTVRPDSMMDLLLILSSYFFVSYLNKKSQPGSLILASVVSVLVIFVKQSGIQMPVILLSFLVFTGNWKGLKIAITTATITFSACFGLMYLLYGKVFLSNVVGGVANGIDTSWFILYVFGYGFKVKILVTAVVVLLITFYQGNIFKADIVTRFLCFCACAMFSFAAITVLKSGSNVAYFAAFFIIALLLIARRLDAFTRDRNIAFNLHAIFLGYICAICILNVIHQTREVKALEFDGRNELVKRETMAADAAHYIQEKIGKNEYVFANLNDESIITDSYGRRGINNILFKYALVPQLDIFKSSNVKSGVLGYANFREYLISGKARFIIESNSQFDFQIIEDLQKIKNSNYKLVHQIGAYHIYQHRKYNY